MANRPQCQSCGMPLRDDSQRGTENDGRLSQRYCTHCYQNGEFTWKSATPEQMQIYSAGVLMREKHWPGFAARWATNGIPKLERWQNTRDKTKYPTTA